MSGKIREIYKEGPGFEEDSVDEEFIEEESDDEEFVEEESEEEFVETGDAEEYADEEVLGEPEFSDADFDEDREPDSEDQEFERRMQKRRARVRGRKRRRKVLGVILIVAVFATLATMCGKDIVRLKAENIALQKQQKELEEERDRLRQEVENSGNREYVQEQARKQFKLLNPGELLFTFEEEN